MRCGPTFTCMSAVLALVMASQGLAQERYEFSFAFGEYCG